MKIVSFWICLFVILLAAPRAQQSPSVSAAAEQNAPSLSPEERRKFAEARDLVMTDPEYSAAVKKVQEAQKAADKLFFAKLRKAAPDLGEYIRYLENARGLTKSAQP